MLTDSEMGMERFEQLVQIVARLRGKDGCPWDQAQTPNSLAPYVLEEVYEVLEAIEQGNDDELRKELGDMVFHVVMLSQMATERASFGIDDVLQRINDKMIDRHPHVFDPSHVPGEDDGGISAWEARKAKERDASVSALDGVPTALPALLRAHRISEKAGVVGFDWPDVAGVRTKLDEELGELDEAITSGDAEAIGEELGDVLFTLVNLGRHLPVDAETALRIATTRFESRFRALEQALAMDGRRVNETSAEALEPLWRKLKGPQ